MSNNRKPASELKLSCCIDKIRIELLAGDLANYKDQIHHLTPLPSREELLPPSSTCLCNVSVIGEVVSSIVKAWHSLSEGQAMRCFIPGYRLTFYLQDKAEKTATICWACNKIVILDKRGQTSCFTVDGSTTAAQELLRLCRTIIHGKLAGAR